MTLREEILSELDMLNDEQAMALLRLIKTFKAPIQREYNEADDPAIGLISGPTDYSERAEEILSDKSGWTQKDS